MKTTKPTGESFKRNSVSVCLMSRRMNWLNGRVGNQMEMLVLVPMWPLVDAASTPDVQKITVRRHCLSDGSCMRARMWCESAVGGICTFGLEKLM